MEKHPTDQDDLPERMKDHRKRNRLRVIDFAEIIGVSETTIWRLETRKYKPSKIMRKAIEREMEC